ncbi:MAG: ATP-binding cassette domain-containing protein [Caldilineales bacterium]|nr:ATP-binding cassette domain-containing protein [Caldilineales bacterium]
MAPPILAVSDLAQSYGARTVLRIARLELAEGELLALVGPSGAGKSTLLRLLNFLERPSQGQICYRGRPYVPETLPLDIRRRITTVFQRPLLLDASVRGNVAYGLRLRGGGNGRGDSHRQEEEALAAVGLQHLARARSRTLSGGEAQRVALARALILRPEILLLDEPTANLDPANVRQIEQMITRISAEMGTTVVLVTHHVWQARRLAHRVGLLYDGELLEIAPTNRFFDHPEHPLTRAFLRGETVF